MLVVSYSLGLSEEEVFATVMAMGNTLFPIHRQGFVPFVGAVGMTFRTDLLFLLHGKQQKFLHASPLNAGTYEVGDGVNVASLVFEVAYFL